jgi:hypothetical protein
MVRYRVKKDRVAEHEELLRAVFDELRRTEPKGIRYGAFRLPDGVSFVHVAFVEADKNPLQALEAFTAFTRSIEDRCDEPPQTAALTQLGSFGL